MLILDLEPVFQAEAEFERACDKVSDGVRRAVARAVDEGAREGINTRGYQDQTGLLTSRIRGYVEVSTPGGAVGVLGAFTDYASFVTDGTKPHEIHGNPFLTFKARDGRWVTTRMVRHPGYRGDRFMTRALLKAERVLLREVEIGVAEMNRYLDG